MPALNRRRTGSWKALLKADWDVMASLAFATLGVWAKVGRTTFYLLVVMELKTRRVSFMHLHHRSE